MQRWMESIAGQTFLNYAYNWGAAIVILGTLFKLTHLAGANLMLFIGMGTEVVVFFISAFDRPFDKEGEDEEEVAESATQQAIGGGGIIIGGGNAADSGTETGSQPIATGATVVGSGTPAVGGGVIGGSTVIFGGGGAAGTNGEIPTGKSDALATPSAGNVSEILEESAASGNITASHLIEVIKMANNELLSRAQAAVTPELEEASKEYTDKLKLLTETLDRVEKQSARLTTDSEEMTNLNRTLTGINTVYELQLKSVSKQITSIDRINEQTHHMAEQIEELNGIYARMIKALTVNMKNAAAQTEA